MSLMACCVSFSHPSPGRMHEIYQSSQNNLPPDELDHVSWMRLKRYAIFIVWSFEQWGCVGGSYVSEEHTADHLQADDGDCRFIGNVGTHQWD